MVAKLKVEHDDGPMIQRRVITPALAAEWLTKAGPNRRVRPHMVDKYAKDVASGRWRLNGEAIVMSKSGKIIDGQHRLLAIVKAGVPIECFVASGIDDEAFDTIDIGANRTLADILGIQGYPQASVLAAIARGWWEYERNGRLGLGGMEVPPSIRELEVVVEAHADRFLDAARATNAHRHLFRGSSAAWAIAWMLFGDIDTIDRDFFFSHLETGADIGEGNPIFALRRVLFDAARTRGKNMVGQILLAMLIKAWNKFRAQEPTSIIIYRASEAMPVPM